MQSYNQRTLELWRRELREAQAILALMRKIRMVTDKTLPAYEQDVCDALDGVWQAQQAVKMDEHEAQMRTNGLAMSPSTIAFLRGAPWIKEYRNDDTQRDSAAAAAP